MKRKFPFSHDSFFNEEDDSSHKQQKIFLQHPLITKFNCTNEDCVGYLSIPKFLSIDIFPEILQNVPLFLLDSNISVGLSSTKPLMCNLTFASFLDANTTFGMDIGRYSHISSLENASIKISKAVEQCVKSIYEVKTGIDIKIKQNKVYLNDKVCEFQNEKDQQYLKTDKILINKRNYAEFYLKNVTDQKSIKKSTPSITLTLYKNKNQTENIINENSISIESDIPLILGFSEEDEDNYEDKDEESDHSDDYDDSYLPCLEAKMVRILAPELEINTEIQSTFCDFFIASKLTVNNDIECTKSFLIRANDLLIQSKIKSNEFIIISSNTTFSNESSLFVSNLCALFANNSLQNESKEMNLSKNTFIKSRTINFLSQKAQRKRSNIEIKMTENEEEEDNNENNEQNCFIQAEKVTVGQNFSIKSESNLSIECSSLNISSQRTSIEIDGKLHLLFVTDKSIEKVGLNEGKIKCNDLFFEINSNDSSPINKCVFKTSNEIKVLNAFLLSSGTLKNTEKVVFRSFYLSSNSKFISKNKSKNSCFIVGDFLAIESNASFVNGTQIRPYSFLKPTILNSGEMTFSYHKKTENKGRGRKKSDDFFSKSGEEKKNLFSFACLKFVSNGEINGDYLSVIADDVISISNNVKCKEINFEANQISIINSASVLAYKATFKTMLFEISKAVIKASNFLNTMLFDNLDGKNNENINGSSFELFYQNEIAGDIDTIRQFELCKIEKISTFRKEVTQESESEKGNKQNKTKK